MNMKLNKNKIIPLCLLSFLLTPFLFSNTTQATISASSPIMIGANVVIEGYKPQTMPLSLDVVSDVTPNIGLQYNSFTEESFSADSLKATGITRTYSDSYYTKIMNHPSMDSATGMYYTLESIPESSFSQIDTEFDSSIFTYAPAKPFYETINDTMYGIDPDYTAANFTTNDMYFALTFDKALVDLFFTDASAKANFASVSTDYSSDKQRIITLLDDVFDGFLYDIAYAVVNTTDYATDWTIEEELRSVLGGNITDVCLDGTVSIVSVRDMLIGELGYNIVPDSVVGQMLRAINPVDPADKPTLFGFAQTPTTYSINFRIEPDFCNSAPAEGYMGILGIFQPAVVTIGGTGFYIFWTDAILIGLAAGAVAGVLAGLIAKSAKKENAVLIGFIAFVSVAVVTFIIVALATMTAVA